MRVERGAVAGVVADREQAGVHHRVQGLDPAVEHLGKAGQRRDVAHRQPGRAQRRRGAAGRDELDAARRQRCRELDEAGLVGDRDQRAGDRHEIVGHGAPPRRVPGAQGAGRASLMRPKDQVTCPRYSTTSARTTTCRAGSGAAAVGSKCTASSSSTEPPAARNIQVSPEGSASVTIWRARSSSASTAGSQVEARREVEPACAGGAVVGGARAGVGDGQDLLAAKLAAAGVDEEPPLVQQPVARHVAVVGREQPLAGVVLRLAHRDQRRPADQPRPEGARRQPLAVDLRRRAPVDLDRRMRGGLPRAQRPVAAEGLPGAGVHHQRLPPDAHLEGERAGVGAGGGVPAGRGGAVHHHHHPAAAQPRVAHGEPRLRLGAEAELGQRLVEALRVAAPAAVERRHAAVAEPQRPDHRHRPHDGAEMRLRRMLALVLEDARGPDQERQDVGEIARRPRRRAALLVDQRLGELAEGRHVQPVLGVRQHQPAPDQPRQGAQLRQARSASGQALAR